MHPNDCFLYRKEYANAIVCPECGESRWKYGKDANKKKKISAKIKWYFPPIPRFQRMFRSVECAKNLTWHANEREIDDKLRHPTDSLAWKLVNTMWPSFSSEPRNLRSTLSADGINPYSDMSSKNSCWPVVMVIYNLTPWLCMKRKFMMLSILISGPKQPGDDIGIYLEPLIDDLKLLWESGVECCDAYIEELFNLRTVLLWTINDFPAYGNLSGCSVKGYKAYPIYEDNTSSIRLKYGKKKWHTLDIENFYHIIILFIVKRNRLMVSDNLEVFLNLCLGGTLLDISGKTKGGLNARRDLADLKIRLELTPINGEKIFFIPPACYTLTKKEKRFLLKSLSEMKVLRGYSSNVMNLVSIEDSKNGLKSHDCHKLQEDIIITLCLLEKYFPPSFFTIMVHLTVHLVREVKLCGPIYLRWMYPFERFMKVEMELATGDVEVSDNLRWIAHGPHPVVTTYSSYAINGCHYHTKSHDKNKTVQNNGVSLVAKTMQVCSSKDKNPIIGEMSFYGVIEEIWELNYNSLKVAIFKCDWVENSGGIKTDELGFVLVDLSRVGHKNDSFIFATQAKRVFFVEDPSDSRWSIVLTPPQRDFEDQYNDDELGDTVLNCQGMPKATIDIESRLDLDENTPTYV
ncbi:hypothetical protein IC575_014319 [Cucumis melo]